MTHRSCAHAVGARLGLVAIALLFALPLPAAARVLPNYDALRQGPGAAATTPSVGTLATDPGVSVDARLGVPKFLWASDLDRVLNARAGAPRAKRLAVTDPVERARAYLADAADLYRLRPAEVDALVVVEQARLADGASLVRFRHVIDGIEVWREEASVLVDRQGALVAIGGFVAGAPDGDYAAATATGRDAAIDTALVEQGFAHGVSAQLVPMNVAGGYERLALPATATGAKGETLAAPLRVKRVWYRLADKLVAAWYVEVQVNDATSRHGTDAYSYVVAADDATVLFRNNLVADAAFSYRVYAEPNPPFLPLPGPGGRGGFPHPTGEPDGYQPPIQPRSLVTLANAPFSRNDPWLTDNATRTIGNNVEAHSNMLEPDGFGTPATDECNLGLPVDGDLHACTTSPHAFDHAYDHGLPPNASRMQVNAVVTNLFYTVNYLHDWFYDAGFDEAARNAQTNNFNRGGVGNDSIYAEAQDYSGSNNANMFTPPDGERPRMRMFLWTSTASLAKVEPPSTTSGVKNSNTAEFGPQAFDLTGAVVAALDAANPDGPTTTDGCTPLTNAPALAGKIALVDRGVCTFVVKARNAQNAGAAAVLIVNNVAPGAPGMAGDDASITIPVLSISLADGNAIKAQLAQGVAMRLARRSALPRDGSFDNTVVAHEWGHYLTNRLVGNSNGLNAAQGRGMGEGWSDFIAMLLVVKEEDRNVPANAGFNGTYPDTPYPHGGPDFAPDVLNNAYYYGLRRYPYSRNMSKNPLTFRHIADDQPLPATPPMSPSGSTAENSEVHNAGEVWASMLWECYGNLLDDTSRLTFTQAQERMKRYLVTGLKMTPLDPTFVDARDALLAAMQAQDPVDHDRCLAGFAKRGLGLGAIAPNGLSEDNIGVVESFRATADPGVKTAAIEYYHAAFDHYFITNIPDEIAKLDRGEFAGWVRTKESIPVYADFPANARPVCRFFSEAFDPKSSHFYTPSANECAIVKTKPEWKFEGEVFAIPVPDAMGNCAAGTTPVYRLYNQGQGAAPNHRYTTSLAIRQTMLGKGWISEGASDLGVVMCAP